MKKAILLVGHGSRRDEANKALERLCGLVGEKRGGAIVAHAYLQFAAPDLPAALGMLAATEVEEVIIVPVFLCEGVHIKEDIPAILAAEAAKYPHMRLVPAPVLGIDQRMAQIVWDRVDAAHS
ncbi:MAG: CbiX/SirB N-terminal domain-containing protein [Dethiobacter sp.]|nr:CbiX/SirB N-terminal domain-containing protein [Dethiobacter sp.]